MSDAITRKEAYLKSISDGTSSALKPITREEQYLAYIAGESKSFPTTPITREEAFLDKIAKRGVSGGGGGSSGGEEESGITVKSLIEGTDTVIESDAPTKVRDFLFYQSPITKVDMSNVIEIGDYAFCKCPNILYATFNKAITIGDYAFSEVGESAMPFPRFTFPKAQNIGERAFYQSQARTLDLPNAISIGKYGIGSLPYLTDVNIPNVTTLGDYALCYNRVPEWNLPNVTKMGIYVFGENSYLTSVRVPNLVECTGEYLCRMCSDLTLADLGKITTLNPNSFENCYRLTAIILSSPTVCTLTGTNFTKCYHLSGTAHSSYNPNGDKDCYIYVPSALIDEYKVATNWSTYATQFRAIEDYPEITGG